VTDRHQWDRFSLYITAAASDVIGLGLGLKAKVFGFGLEAKGLRLGIVPCGFLDIIASA